MGFNATCLLKLCLAVSWWVLPSLNYSGAVLCTTKCYLSFGLELAVCKTGMFSLHKLVLLLRELVPPACCPALSCPALSLPWRMWFRTSVAIRKGFLGTLILPSNLTFCIFCVDFNVIFKLKNCKYCKFNFSWQYTTVTRCYRYASCFWHDIYMGNLQTRLLR